ncbi:MAG TPA: hypothetical protein VJ872_07625 [Nocardioides sp.]|nr:hypothetical protein [Nocardioides sp.]
MVQCGNCGAQQGDASDRFCRACGTPYATAPVAPAAPPPPPPTMAPPTVPPPPAPGNRRRLVLLGVAASIVLALVAGGLVVWSVLRSSGGASSPDEAVTKAVSAIAGQDSVALLDMVAPAEVSGITDLAQKLRTKLREQDLSNGNGITDAISVKVSDVQVKTDTYDGGFARVTVTGGTYTASWDPSKLASKLASLGDLVPAETRTGSLTEPADQADVDPTVVTEKIDGRWYVTLIGTGLYQAYSHVYAGSGDPAASLDWKAADNPPAPIVSSTPEGTFGKLADAINSRDVATLLANFDPALVKPMLPYTAWMQDALDRHSSAANVQVSDAQVQTEDIGGGKVRAAIQHLSVKGSATDDSGRTGTFEATIESGGCFTGSSVDPDGYTDDSHGCMSDVPAFGLLGFHDITVVMDKVDGGYRLDPTGTVVDYGNTLLDHLDKDVVNQLTNGMLES